MITPQEELSVVIPADWVPGPPQGSWTYDEYAALATLKRHHEDPFIQAAPLIVETIIKAARRIQHEAERT